MDTHASSLTKAVKPVTVIKTVHAADKTTSQSTYSSPACSGQVGQHFNLHPNFEL